MTTAVQAADASKPDPQAAVALLRKFGKVDDATIARLVEVKSLFQLSDDDIYIRWEAFAVTHDDGDTQLNVRNVGRFELYLLLALAPAHKTPLLKKVRDLSNKRKPMDFLSSPVTPQVKKQKPAAPLDLSPLRDAPVLSPTKRELSNAVLETLNPAVAPVDSAGKALLSANFDAEKYRFRTMAMKLLESADVLDEQIDLVSLQLLDLHKDSDLSLGNPCMSSQLDIFCCGRIVPDSPVYDPAVALNETSLFLETSRLGGIGQRIPLDLSQLGGFSLFPGQIVALKGHNPTGRVFIVHEVVPLPPLGMPVSPLLELAGTADAKVFIAAGPFCSQHTLNYTKLAALVEHLNTNVKPQVAILLGPFLDLQNACVESGEFDASLVNSQQPKSLDDVFRAVVTPILKELDPSIQVVLLPSLRDTAAKHASYPQSSFDRKKLGLPKNFKCFPNPSGFSVNEVLFGASNLDIFRDLKEVYKPGPGQAPASNRFDRVANHVFEQKRYYPLFPGSVKTTGQLQEEADRLSMLRDGVVGHDLAKTAVGGSCLEVPYLGLTELGDSLPDVMIVPSEMKYFARVTNGVVVLNPGQFVRPSRDAAREDGSYMVMSVKAPLADEEQNIEPVDGADGLYYHNVYKRCRVDIYRS